MLELGLARLQDRKTPEEELTGEDQVMGTVDYMSPEQAMETRSVDIRTDIYSLGCTLYKLLVGHAPFSRPEYETPIQKVMGHARDPVPPVREFRAEIPEALAAAIERMMAKEPDGRFAVPAEVGDALAPFCNGSDLPALLTKAGPASQPVAEIAGPETSTESEQASAHTGTNPEPLREADSPAKPPIVPASRRPSDSELPVLSREPEERFADLRSRIAAKRPSAAQRPRADRAADGGRGAEGLGGTLPRARGLASVLLAGDVIALSSRRHVEGLPSGPIPSA